MCASLESLTCHRDSGPLPPPPTLHPPRSPPHSPCHALRPRPPPSPCHAPRRRRPPVPVRASFLCPERLLDNWRRRIAILAPCHWPLRLSSSPCVSGHGMGDGGG